MAYILDEKGKAIVKLVKDFMENEVAPYVVEYDRSGEYPEFLYKKACDLGLNKLEIPKEVGGYGLDYITIAACVEEMAKVDAGFSTGLNSTSLALKPILLYANPELKKWACEYVVNGGTAAFALTEPAAGSDAGAVRTRAVKVGDEYIINGTKCFITGAAHSQVMSVIASTDPTKGSKGLSAFVVPSDTPGVSFGKHEDKMGIRLSETSEIIFEDVHIPASNLLGKEGEGFKVAMGTLNLARPIVGAAAVGIAQRALEEAVKYSKERIAFGKPIAKQQGVSFKIAEMAARCEGARQAVAHAFRLYEAGLPYLTEAAISKYLGGQAAVQNALDAIQIFGGYGYIRDYPVEKLLRDSKIFTIFEGTDEVQKITIAGQLLR